TGGGLLIRLGETEQTIALRKEEEADEHPQTPRRLAEEASASDPEMALVGADRSSGAGPLLDASERALRGETGDRCDRGGGDLTGDVLPAGDAGAQRDAAGLGPRDERGERGGEWSAPADQPARGEAPEARAEEAQTGAASLDDEEASHAEATEAEGPENRLDEEWQMSFSTLEGERGSGGIEFDPDADWRGRALSWERKLAGQEGPIDGQDLRADAAATAGAGATVPADRGGHFGRTDGERGSSPARALAQSLPDPHASGPAGSSGSAARQADGTASPAGVRETTSPGGGSPPAGEPATSRSGGNDRSSPGSGERAAEGPGGTPNQGSEAEVRGGRMSDAVTSSMEPEE